MVVNCDQYMIAGTDRAHDMIAPNVDVDMNYILDIIKSTKFNEVVQL